MTSDLGVASLLLVLAVTGHWFWRAMKVDIPRAPGLYAAGWGLSATLGVIALALGAQPIAATVGLVFGLMFLYFVLTGAQNAGDGKVKVGDKLPQFAATDDSGAQFLSSELDGRPALIKFFRGHW